MDSNEWFDDFGLEKVIKQKFGVTVDVDKAIVRRIPVGPSVSATVFLTNKKQLYCYIDGQARLLLSDVKKIISHMGLVAESYFPPKGRPDYFNETGRKKFSDVFPGRHDIGLADIAFYRTLSPYCPALVAIRETRDGVIYRADSDSHGGWRPVAKFAYRRIKTS